MYGPAFGRQMTRAAMFLVVVFVALGVLLGWLLFGCTTRIYAPMTVTTTVCVKAEVDALLTAKAAEELAKATDACLAAAHGEAVRRATDPDGGTASVEHHGRVVQWLLNEWERRRHRDGGVK